MNAPRQIRTGTQRHSYTHCWVGWLKFITLIAGLVIAWPLVSYAQQPHPAPMKRVGILAQQVRCPIPLDTPIPRRLAELGWIEGKTFVFDCLSSVDRLNQLPALARELVSRNPDVIMAAPISFVMALKHETATIPIVMYDTWEPVRVGVITSLARPGGNITGFAWFDLLSKQMELLKEIVPHMRRVAYIAAPSPPPPEVSKVAGESITSAASTLGFTWQFFRPATVDDYDEIFARVAEQHFDAAFIPPVPSHIQNSRHIKELALRHRIPTVTEEPGWIRGEGGLLLAYGQDYNWTTRLATDYVDKILRGAEPSDLPVEQATKVLLAINLKTAKSLGLTIPPSLLARADEVIE